MFLDACHSGAAGTGIFATNDQAASEIAKDIPTGVTIFAASKGRERSGEHSSVGAGFFSHAVANVIANERQKYDVNANGHIEVSELYKGVKTQVLKLNNGLQTPWMVRNEMVGEFALF